MKKNLDYLRKTTTLDRFVVEPVTRAVFLRLDYRFGGGPGRPPQSDFQYENGGGGPGPGPS
jgi:hypothetical protein